MKTYKKVLALLLVVVMGIALFGCASNGNEVRPPSPSPMAPQSNR